MGESSVPGASHVFYRSSRKKYPTAVKSEGVYIYDSEGKRYLDGSSGALVVNIGHGVQRIAQVMAEQASRLAFSHGSQFTSEPQEKLAALLAEMAPGDLDYAYFTSGGSEATETALKLARQYHLERGKVRKSKVIARWTSYHGNTIGALSMSGNPGRRRPYSPLLLDFPHIPPAYCFRCPFGMTHPECDLKCAQALEDEIVRQGPENVSAFIAEPVVGASAGALPAPSGYFQRIREICDRHDVLFIADEVMCGCGRTGKDFAIQHWDVVPDILVTAKGMASGYAPLAATIVRREIHDAFEKGSGQFVHGHTYGGSPLSCAVGFAVLSLAKEWGLAERAAEQGDYMRSRLEELYKYPFVGDVRGKGLMLGIELVKDRATKEPFPPELHLNSKVGSAAFANGLITYPGGGSVDGSRGDHILLGPPLVITRAEIDELVGILDLTLDRVNREVLN